MGRKGRQQTGTGSAIASLERYARSARRSPLVTIFALAGADFCCSSLTNRRQQKQTLLSARISVVDDRPCIHEKREKKSGGERKQPGRWQKFVGAELLVQLRSVRLHSSRRQRRPIISVGRCKRQPVLQFFFRESVIRMPEMFQMQLVRKLPETNDDHTVPRARQDDETPDAGAIGRR